MTKIELLTVLEAAESLTLKPKTIRAWIGARRLGVVHLGRAVRIPHTEIVRIIDEGTIPPQTFAEGSRIRRRRPPRG
jgi:excisionase family DNA binding protein